MRARWDGRQCKGRGRKEKVREGGGKGTYAGTSCPRAKFGTINKIEQDQIPPLYQEE